MTIPREALIGSMKNPQVYIVEGGIARLRSLVVSAETGNRIEVLGEDVRKMNRSS